MDIRSAITIQPLVIYNLSFRHKKPKTIKGIRSENLCAMDDIDTFRPVLLRDRLVRRTGYGSHMSLALVMIGLLGSICTGHVEDVSSREWLEDFAYKDKKSKK